MCTLCAENLQRRDHFEDLDVDGRITLRHLDGSVGWIQLVQYMVQWGTVLNLIIIFKLLSECQFLQDGLCSMELGDLLAI
jgi:hypothetical protein